VEFSCQVLTVTLVASLTVIEGKMSDSWNDLILYYFGKRDCSTNAMQTPCISKFTEFDDRKQSRRQRPNLSKWLQI